MHPVGGIGQAFDVVEIRHVVVIGFGECPAAHS
jgi:hypothetical protein